MGETDQFVAMLDTVLAPIPEAQRELMKRWAEREIASTAIITRATARLWVDAYLDDAEKEHPAGWRMVNWAVGAASPSNPGAVIWAMLQTDVAHVGVYSFQLVKDEAGEEGVVYFKERIYEPSTTYGPVTTSALFEEFSRYFATEEELEKLESVGALRGAPAAQGAPS